MRRRQKEPEADKVEKVLPNDPFIVIASGNINDVLTILEQGVNVNKTRWSGFSLLHKAAQMGFTDVCELLIMKGADVNLKSARGWYTPLHMALANGYTETAYFLIQSGANAWTKSKYKEDAFDYASKSGFKKLSEEFRSVIAKQEMMATIKKHQGLLKGVSSVVHHKDGNVSND